jgi:hypothetical protein
MKIPKNRYAGTGTLYACTAQLVVDYLKNIWLLGFESYPKHNTVFWTAIRTFVSQLIA